MKPRAFQDLAKFDDETFFGELAIGLPLIAQNARRIDQDARFMLESGKHHSARILTSFAEEEAAKYLILLDAARCPQDQVSAHLSKCDIHLAKGIYAQACGMRPSSFAELRRWIQNVSQDYYLDGPNGDDWIFRNHILNSRESALYVDLVESDGTYSWDSPHAFDELAQTISSGSPVIDLVIALDSLGFAKREALKAISKRWREIRISDDLDVRALRANNAATLGDLRELGLMEEPAEPSSSVVTDRWSYPLHGLVLRPVKVDKAQLENERVSRAVLDFRIEDMPDDY